MGALRLFSLTWVPLGVELKNEAYLVDMTQIMDSSNHYVPLEEVNVDGKEYTYDSSRLMQILLFGDKLTVARARGASTFHGPERR